MTQTMLEFTPTRSEMALAGRRRESNAQKILRRLQSGPAGSFELMEIGGLRYGARVFDLRKDGWVIEREDHMEDGREWSVYTLVGRVENP